MENASSAPHHADDGGRLCQFASCLAESLSSALLVMRRDWIVAFANPRFCEQTRLAPAAVTGRPLGDVLGQGFFRPPVLADAARQVMEQGAPRTLMLAPQWQPGEPVTLPGRLYQVRLDVVRRPGGELLLLFDDRTEEQRLAEELTREKQLLESVIDVAGAALVLLDARGGVIWANGAFVRWFGPTHPGRTLAGTLFQAPIERLRSFGPEDAEVVQDNQALELDQAEWSSVRPDGRRCHYRTVAFLILRPATGVAGTTGAAADGTAGRLAILLVTRDVTEERDREEQLQRLRQLGEMMQEERNIHRVLYRLLTFATAGHALGFNRAFFFRVNEERWTLDGELAVGPASREEAWRVWSEIAQKKVTLEGLIAATDLHRADHPLQQRVRELSYSLAGEQEILVRAVREKQILLVHDAQADPRVTPGFRERFQADEFVVVPLIARGRVSGVLLADNLYSGQPIAEEVIDHLAVFAGYGAIALENAAAYDALHQRMEELRQTQDAMLQRERLALVGRLTARVAHEIRNPLVTIGGFARAIVKHHGEAQRCQDAARIIQEEVTRLEVILHDILDFSRPPKSLRMLSDLNEVVRHTCMILRGTLRERRVGLEERPAEGLPQVPIDRSRIQQVLHNLIRNAADAIGAGGGTVTISTAVEKAALRPAQGGPEPVGGAGGQEVAVLRVRDDGAGLAQEAISRLGEPFFTTKPGGVGLGLATTKMIVQDHGGSLEASNNSPERGATMTVRLPLRVPEPPAERGPGTEGD